jgi:hypothetical protein
MTAGAIILVLILWAAFVSVWPTRKETPFDKNN